MTLGDLIDRCQALLQLEAADAFKVAQELYNGERDYTDAQIKYAAVKLGVVEDRAKTAAEAVASEHGELLTDEAEILAEVYKHAPRVLCEGMPVIGRRPKDHEISAELEELLADLPEEIRVCILDIDLFSGQATFSLYDETNDVDRNIGPIDLTRYDSANALNEAIMTLLKRLPKVLAADFN